MKYSLAISAAAHVLFIASIVVPAYQGRSADSEQIISVSLLSGVPAAGATSVTAAATQEPESAKPSPSKMAYKSADGDKKTKKTPEKPKGATPADKAAGLRAGGKSGGGSGIGSGPGGGNIVVDEQDFRFAYYLEVLRERIGYNWAPPPILGSPSEATATVYFKISRDGTISGEKIEKTSKYEIFDRSAVRAVKLSDPLPPLPAGFKGKYLGVHFEFEHNPG